MINPDMIVAGFAIGWLLRDTYKLRRRVKTLETQVKALWPKPAQGPIIAGELRRPTRPAPGPGYECPVCGSDNPSAYLNCHRPNCTDGRDPR